MNSQKQILTEMLKGRLSNIKNDVELALLNVEGISELEISCPKCHGTGEYNYDFLETDENGKFLHNDNKCDVCYGTGKVTVEFYEDIQKASRGE